jgi:signal transduction histidine kinase
MFLHNKELRRGMIFLSLSSLCLSVFAFIVDITSVWFVLLAGTIMIIVYLLTERYRYRKLQTMIMEIDRLLTDGTGLRITQYEEGELSLLASQIEKITLRLQEAALSQQKEKDLLADSLADISHQLRTPLTAMNLTASMLRSPELTNEKRLQLTAELSGLLNRTDWLVETLLKLSRLDAGMIKLSPRSVFIRELLNRAIEPLLIPMDLRDQKLKIISADGQITVDPVWTAEAIGNILKNAMEYTPAGGDIIVMVEETALFIQLSIEDSGPGFDCKDIAHLFDRFYKGSNAGEGSCGIGLSLARTVIAAQNGTIRVSNGKNGGVFTVRFYKQTQ